LSASSSTPTPTHAHHRSLREILHERRERKKKEQKDKKERKDKTAREHLLKKHRENEAKFLVESEHVGDHLKGKDLRRAIELKEKELQEKETLAAAGHSGSPISGSSGRPASGSGSLASNTATNPARSS
jgi:hypothetical protein